MATHRLPVPPKGMGVFHIPKSTVDAMLRAAGLDPRWVMTLHLYSGMGEAELSVPYRDLAEPLVDAAGMDPDGYTSNREKIEEVFGPNRWQRSSDNPDYEGKVQVFVVDDRKEDADA